MDGLFGPLIRLSAAEDHLDARAPEILTYHAAVEYELGVALTKLMPRGDRLKGLGFGHLVRVLMAAWPAWDADAGDKVGEFLLRFNELRNAVAHADKRKEVDRHLRRLVEAHRAVGLLPLPAAGEPDPDVKTMAMGITAYIASSVRRQPPPISLRLGTEGG